jgi:hypothetical protein
MIKVSFFFFLDEKEAKNQGCVHFLTVFEKRKWEIKETPPTINVGVKHLLFLNPISFPKYLK